MESWIIRTLADKKNISVHDANYSLFSVLINSTRGCHYSSFVRTNQILDETQVKKNWPNDADVYR